MEKISPIIPNVRKISTHVEEQLDLCARGKKHTSPAKAADVAMLQEVYKESKLHVYVPGREIDPRDKVEDFVTDGFLSLLSGKKIDDWAERHDYERASDKEYDSPDEIEVTVNTQPSCDQESEIVPPSCPEIPPSPVALISPHLVLANHCPRSDGAAQSCEVALIN